MHASHPELATWLLRPTASAELLFCENETNTERLFGTPNSSAHPKDAINDYVVHGDRAAVNPARTGTKVAAHHVLEIPAGREREHPRSPQRVRRATARRRRRRTARSARASSAILAARRAEADEFYATVIPAPCTPTARW